MGVFDLEKLADLVISRMGPLTVEPKRCSRTRSPLSKCSRCVDICPRKAITAGKAGLHIGDHCLECGLCAGVCPTGALAMQEPTQLALLEKIASLGTQGVTVAVGCRRQPELNTKGLSVPCLGSLSLAFLLVLQRSPYPVYLVLPEKECARCPVTGGGRICLERLAEAEQLLASLGLTGGAVRLVEEAPPVTLPKRKEETNPSRRAFFRSIFSGAKQVPKAVVLSVLGEAEKETSARPAVAAGEVDRQQLLKKGLAAKKESLQELSLLKRPVLKSICHFCRACSLLCPLGALQCSDDYRLTLDAGRCTGCGLCVESCIHRSLTLAPGTIAGLFREEPEVLAQGNKGRCPNCGQEMIVSGDQETCFMCAKRAGLFAH